MTRALAALLAGVLGGAVGAADAATFYACLGRRDARKVIRFWGVGREGHNAEELFDEFLREHPDVRNDIQKQPWTAEHEKNLTAYAGQSVRFLVEATDASTASLVEAGLGNLAVTQS